MLDPKTVNKKILAKFRELGVDSVPIIYKNAAAPEGSFAAFSTAEAFLLCDDVTYIVPGNDRYLSAEVFLKGVSGVYIAIPGEAICEE